MVSGDIAEHGRLSSRSLMHFNDIELTTETYDDVALGAYVAGRRLTHDGIEASPSGLKARLDVVGGVCPGERGSSVRAGHLLPGRLFLGLAIVGPTGSWSGGSGR